MNKVAGLQFTGERIVPEAVNCEPNFALKMYQEHVARYLLAAQFCDGKSVIDVGCGVGYGAQLLAQRGAKSVVAFDLSEDAIAHARANYSHERVTYFADSVHDVQFSEQVDLITCFELIEHVEHQDRVVRRLARALKPDGLLVISTPRALAEKRTHFHTHEFGLGEFEDLLLEEFSQVKFYFENNHFASLIADEAPSEVASITYIKDQFHLKQADYFIVVATKSKDVKIPETEPVLVVNDDRYVTLLEHDVEVLHKAEDDLKEVVAARLNDIEQLRDDVNALNSAVDGARNEAAALQSRVLGLEDQIDFERRELTRAIGNAADAAAEYETKIQTLSRELEEYSTALAEHATQAADAAAEYEAKIQTLSREREEYSAAVAEHANQLSQERLAAREALSGLERRMQSEIAELQIALKLARDDLSMSLENAKRVEQSLRSDIAVVTSAKLAGELEASNRINDLKVQVAGLEASANEAQQAAEAAQRALNAELNHYKHVLRLTEDALTETRASTSWKITAPLRLLSSVCRAPFVKVGRLLRFYRENGQSSTVRLLTRKLRSMGARDISGGAQYGPATQLGQTEPLSSPTESQHALPASSKAFDLVMFIGCWEGESKRYRVFNVADALRRTGYSVKVHPVSECSDYLSENWTAKAVVFFRSPLEPSFRIHEVIDRARSQNAKVVFDIDDLVFDPSLVDAIHGVSMLSSAQKMDYLDGVRKYRRLLLECDLVTVTTTPLARAVEALGMPVAIVPNSINREQIDASAHLLRKAKAPGGRLRIGYFSGSRTHERDFAQAEGALLELMASRSDWEFLIVGYLELGDAWRQYADRIVRMDFMKPLDMLARLAECDINIAPLEVGDMFCEAKSELKFFEAALVETPTVASPTEPFKQAIEDGQTGFLASAKSEWFLSLDALLTSAELRATVGRRARLAALEKYGIEATSIAAEAALFGRDRTRASASASSSRDNEPHTLSAGPRLKIDWIIPRLIIGGGGHRNILRAAHHLQNFGHSVALHFTSSDDQARQLPDLVRDNFYPFEGQIKVYDGQFRETDVIIATHWTTVDAALRAKSRTKEIMYFVQDFEPAFAPMGSEYVLAENTYRQGLYCITSGPWCERLLRAEYNSEADHFRFPIDRDVYRVRPRTKSNRNIIFFAKPEMPRRCFEIGAMALEHVHHARPDIEIILFGSRHAKDKKLNFPVTYLEIVPTIDDLAQMYSNADLGIVFSTTNPSLVPYEMMSSGCPVVDLRRPGNEYNYDNRDDIAYLADPIPENMAREIVELIGREDELEARRQNGLQFTRGFPEELDMARRVEHLILQRMLAKHG